MQLSNYAQGGAIVVALGVIIYTVKYFIAYLKARDKDFNDLVKNHLTHNTRSNQKLASVIEELLRFLKFNNNQNHK